MIDQDRCPGPTCIQHVYVEYNVKYHVYSQQTTFII